MSEEKDFEQTWLSKFSDALYEIVGEGITKEVLQGSEGLSSQSNRKEVIDWTKKAMERLESLVEKEKCQEIMTRCACQYPKSDLQEIRKKYEETNDINSAHRVLQEQFESFLRNTLKLNDDLVEEIVKNGWGAAGVKKGNTIIAIKIPKGSNLIKYMNEKDPDKKRQYYCHCPRIREVFTSLKSSGNISPTYCYCGAGFFKGIWEEILQKPVQVELLESLLKGNEVCKIAVHLPLD